MLTVTFGSMRWVCLLFMMSVLPIRADFTALCSLGVWDGNPEDEFGDTTWQYNAAPGSATALDNDFYFAGSYPAPIGTVAGEPATNLERALDSNNLSVRLHFNLSPAQATSTARMRLNMHQVWGGVWNTVTNSYGEGYGKNQFEVFWNGVLLKTEVQTKSDTLIVEANTPTFTAVSGANVLEIRRAPAPASSPDGWIHFDALSLEIDPIALQDSDGDGLPRWWEMDHGFSDAVANATQDVDGDGRTNAQEFATGTEPSQKDTDGDGLSDGAEFIAGTNPLKTDTDGDSVSDREETASSPLLADTDGDGAGDAWELRAGYLANSAASTPPVQSGVIGINFVMELNPDNLLASQEVTGLVPQRLWNNTWALTGWRNQNGTQGDIATPTPDVISDSTGAATSMTMSWAFDGTWANGQSGAATQKLLDGYLNVSSNTPGSLTISGIPFSQYDVIVYVGTSYDGAVAYARLNDTPATDRWFLSASTPPQAKLVELVKSDAIKPWRANAIRYRNVSGASVNIKLARTSSGETGVHGIQIVNSALDTDTDGMPDAYEWEHGFKTLVADATLDADGDGLTNAAERALQTNPRLADTDGDGLSDAAETTTNPLWADTDGDSLSDGDELKAVPVATNPNNADSDSDGISDADEVGGWTNPNALQSLLPIISTSPRTLDWIVENVQVIWDHARGGVADQEWGDHSLMNFQIVNPASTGSDAFNVGIRVKAGRVSHFLYSGYGGGFSHPDNDDDNIWEADWQDFPVDLKAVMGFSGFGSHDISDRLRFRIQGSSSGSRTNWNFTFSITNQDTNATVVSRSFSGCALAQNAHDGSVTWQDRSDPPLPNRLQTWVHDGVRVFLNATPLENIAAFAAWKDTDEDGMTDAWEDTYGLNKNSAADASLDGDADGLTNVKESLAGTSPTDADSDDDLAKDGLEVDSGSDPLLAASLPPLYRGLPLGVTGEDVNGNGLSDVWEQWIGRFDLTSNADNDGDGVSNADEAIAGTNPLDPNSRLWSQAFSSAGSLMVRWPALPLKRHEMLESTNLTSWSLVSGVPVMMGSEYQRTFAVSGDKKFYRARVSDLDTDSDGVSDWAETQLGSTLNTASSTRSSVSIDANLDGTPESSASGDYTTMVEQFQGASATATSISRVNASRFLMQAGFGPTLEDIQRVQTLGYGGWITQQMGLPATRQADYIQSIYDNMTSQRKQENYSRGGGDSDPFLFGNNMQTAFARAAIQSSDQLRQRVAFALSQILVTSRRDANLENRCLGMADYYDLFVRHAFGNYEDVLMEVTMHPVMGRYLSHVGNQKADPSINRYPDENYAREVMQLFTIGLWKLNPDGSRLLVSGQPVPTYSNDEITQLARVMTGFWFGGDDWSAGGWTEQDYASPMSLHADRHDFGAKTLLDGFVIPARAATADNAQRDVRDAIHHLFEHPNTGIFISKQLIQFLVTDNPSPAYVQRISSVFNHNGGGVRGDLGAVVRAILLDPEARAPIGAQASNFGRLKEPVIRAMAMARVFGMKQVPDLLWWDWSDFYNESRQSPTNSPSVFNFYRPEYRAPGLATQNGLATPVFQITDSYSSISFPNRLWRMLEEGFSLYEQYRFPLDLARESMLATSPERLMDHLNLLLCAGQMKPTTRAHILAAINQIPTDQITARVRVAAYLALTCPEGAVMR
jgi:uncharacterized protein (DUF1800 family)